MTARDSPVKTFTLKYYTTMADDAILDSLWSRFSYNNSISFFAIFNLNLRLEFNNFNLS